jgi:N-acetylneuraminate synthase
MKSVKLGKTVITEDSLPYIIAEIGVNHEGSMERARDLILQAKNGGAHAAKFQTYKATTLASKHSPSYWDLSKESTTSQYELFQKYDCFNESDYIELANYCKEQQIDFLSTPFDDQAVEFLDPLMDYYKIASADLTNIPFLRKIGAKKKPVLLSTGASTLGETDIAIEELRKTGCDEIVLLHCVLNYPTENKSAYLDMISSLKRSYPDLIIGYSDHTIPDEFMTPCITAWLLGAVVLEKHFTFDRSLDGNDHYHAMNQEDCKQLCKQVERIKELRGPLAVKAPTPQEGLARINARRSIVLTKAASAGTILDASYLTYKRPGTGISPIHWDDVLGRTVSQDLDEDHLLLWKDLV